LKLSARNALKGKVVEVAKGQIMAKVKIDIGGQIVTSLVSVEAVEDLGLEVGSDATAIIKSTEVMLAK